MCSVGLDDMKPAFIIPTDNKKSKIPHTFSYSVGAERISEALQDVPQIKDLCVSFSDFDCAKHLREGAKVHPLLEVHYCHPRPGLSSTNAMIERGWYSPKWEIRVWPVVRDLKHIVTELLRAEGLPRVREWLLNHEALRGREEFRRITLLFDEQAGRLTYEEYSHV
jgi:hypothetical protein